MLTIVNCQKVLMQGGAMDEEKVKRLRCVLYELAKIDLEILDIENQKENNGESNIIYPSKHRRAS